MKNLFLAIIFLLSISFTVSAINGPPDEGVGNQVEMVQQQSDAQFVNVDVLSIDHLLIFEVQSESWRSFNEDFNLENYSFIVESLSLFPTNNYDTYHYKGPNLSYNNSYLYAFYNCNYL